MRPLLPLQLCKSCRLPFLGEGLVEASKQILHVSSGCLIQCLMRFWSFLLWQSSSALNLLGDVPFPPGALCYVKRQKHTPQKHYNNQDGKFILQIMTQNTTC